MIRTVAHFIDTAEFGGAERALVHLLTGLDRRAWRPVLFHHDEPGLGPLVDAADAAGIERRIVRPLRGPRGLAGVPGFARALGAAGAAVFHAHLNWPLACSGGLLAARLARVPSVATVQLFSGFPRAGTMGLQRRLVPRSVGRYIAVSAAVADDIATQLQVPRDRIRVVPNGVAIDDLEHAPSSNAAARRSPTVLTLARLAPQKGLPYLLRAAAMLPGVSFVIAGEGAERASLEREARDLGVSDRVTFVGFRTDTAALLAEADILVLPSVNEGLPLAVLEAMAAGRPVVATAVGGTPEIVHDRETGLLVPPADPGALARAIGELLADPPLARRLAEAGRALVRSRLSSAATARGVAGVYDELLAARETGQ
jgi:glycosyltransferase involved in cell wall biosynthesis